MWSGISDTSSVTFGDRPTRPRNAVREPRPCPVHRRRAPGGRAARRSTCRRRRRGAEQREERRVLRDRQELAVAERPARRREVESERCGSRRRMDRTRRSPRLAREDAEQRNDVVDAQERLHVVVRLAAADRRDRWPRSLPAFGSSRRCTATLGRLRDDVAGGLAGARGSSTRARVVVDAGSAASSASRSRRRPSRPSDRWCRPARSLVDRHAALQVRQRERLLAVAAVGRADQVNSASFSEIGISWPSQNAQPAGGEVAPEHPDLADVWLPMSLP